MVPDGLLVGAGRLSPVSDFGCSAVGDPACGVVIASTFLFGEPEAFRAGEALIDEVLADHLVAFDTRDGTS